MGGNFQAGGLGAYPSRGVLMSERRSILLELPLWFGRETTLAKLAKWSLASPVKTVLDDSRDFKRSKHCSDFCGPRVESQVGIILPRISNYFRKEPTR